METNGEYIGILARPGLALLFTRLTVRPALHVSHRWRAHTRPGTGFKVRFIVIARFVCSPLYLFYINALHPSVYFSRSALIRPRIIARENEEASTTSRSEKRSLLEPLQTAATRRKEPRTSVYFSTTLRRSTDSRNLKYLPVKVPTRFSSCLTYRARARARENDYPILAQLTTRILHFANTTKRLWRCCMTWAQKKRLFRRYAFEYIRMYAYKGSPLTLG